MEYIKAKNQERICVKNSVKMFIVFSLCSFLKIYPVKFAPYGTETKPKPALSRKELFEQGNAYMYQAAQQTMETPQMPDAQEIIKIFKNRKNIETFILATNLHKNLSENMITALEIKNGVTFALTKYSPRYAATTYDNYCKLKTQTDLIAKKLITLRNRQLKVKNN